MVVCNVTNFKWLASQDPILAIGLPSLFSCRRKIRDFRHVKSPVFQSDCPLNHPIYWHFQGIAIQEISDFNHPSFYFVASVPARLLWPGSAILE
jgi:hypothetical protein